MKHTKSLFSLREVIILPSLDRKGAYKSEHIFKDRQYTINRAVEIFVSEALLQNLEIRKRYYQAKYQQPIISSLLHTSLLSTCVTVAVATSTGVPAGMRARFHQSLHTLG